MLVKPNGEIADVVQGDTEDWKETVEVFGVLDRNRVFDFIMPSGQIKDE